MILTYFLSMCVGACFGACFGAGFVALLFKPLAAKYIDKAMVLTFDYATEAVNDIKTFVLEKEKERHVMLKEMNEKYFEAMRKFNGEKKENPP
jgi:hypothetical protein